MGLTSQRASRLPSWFSLQDVAKLVDLRYIGFYKVDKEPCCIFQTDDKESLEKWCLGRFLGANPNEVDKMHMLDLDNKVKPDLSFTLDVSLM